MDPAFIVLRTGKVPRKKAMVKGLKKTASRPAKVNGSTVLKHQGVVVYISPN
jgi:hypothetical protein